MSKTITMNIRMDKETRRKLKEFAGQVGLPATSLVNASIKQMLRNKQLVISTDLEPTQYLEKIIKEAEADYAAGKNITTTHSDKETLTFLRSIK